MGTNIIKNGRVENKPNDFLLTFEILYFVDNIDPKSND